RPPQGPAGNVVGEKRRVVDLRHPREPGYQHPKGRGEAPVEHRAPPAPPYIRLRGLQVLVEVSADDRKPADRAVQKVGPPASPDEVPDGVADDRPGNGGSDDGPQRNPSL